MLRTVYSIFFVAVHLIMCEGCADELILGPYGTHTDLSTKVEFDVNDVLTITDSRESNVLKGFTVKKTDDTFLYFGAANKDAITVITNIQLLKTASVKGYYTYRLATNKDQLKSLVFTFSDGSPTVTLGNNAGATAVFTADGAGKILQKIAIYSYSGHSIMSLQFTFCTAPAAPAGGDADPHFMIRMPGSDVPICFNYDVRPGSVIQLVHDDKTGLTVNAKLVSKFTPGRKLKTWMGKIAIMNKQNTVFLSPMRVWFNSTSISWETTLLDIKLPNQVKITIIEKKKMILEISDGVKFAILRHQFGTNGNQPDYLGFFILNQEGFSKSVNGLIGQFRHETVAVKKSLMTASSNDHNATLYFPKTSMRKLQKEIYVNKAIRYDTYLQKDISCWFTHNNGQDFLNSNFMDYIVPNLSYKKLARGLIRKKISYK